MSVLRDKRLTELNELLVRCQDAGLHYRDAAEWAPQPELASFLSELASERLASGRELSEHIRALGDLPDALDSDREFISRVGALLKAAVSDPHDLTEVLERQAARLESGIVEQAERSLATAISGAARTSVQRLRDSALAAERRLEQ